MTLSLILPIWRKIENCELNRSSELFDLLLEWNEQCFCVKEKCLCWHNKCERMNIFIIIFIGYDSFSLISATVELLDVNGSISIRWKMHWTYQDSVHISHLCSFAWFHFCVCGVFFVFVFGSLEWILWNSLHYYYFMLLALCEMHQMDVDNNQRNAFAFLATALKTSIQANNKAHSM